MTTFLMSLWMNIINIKITPHKDTCKVGDGLPAVLPYTIAGQLEYSANKVYNNLGDIRPPTANFCKIKIFYRKMHPK